MGAGTRRRKGWVQALCLAPPGSRTANSFLESAGETRASFHSAIRDLHEVTRCPVTRAPGRFPTFPGHAPLLLRKSAPEDLARF